MALSPENITKLQQVRDELTTEPDPEESDAEVEPFLKKLKKYAEKRLEIIKERKDIF